LTFKRELANRSLYRKLALTMATRREFLGSIAMAAASTAASRSQSSLASQVIPAECELHGSDGMRVVSMHKAVFSKPPHNIPFRYRVDAPLLGNGDMLAALAGAPECPQLWITTNDFWELKNETWIMGLAESVLTPSGNGQGGPRPVGRFILEVPAMIGAGYHVEQDFATATTTATYQAHDATLELRSWVAATENLLVVELTAKGRPLDANLVFHFPDELGLGVTECAPLGGLDIHPLQEKGIENQVLWATRTYEEGVDVPTKAALAAHFVEGPPDLCKRTFNRASRQETPSESRCARPPQAEIHCQTRSATFSIRRKQNFRFLFPQRAIVRPAEIHCHRCLIPAAQRTKVS